MWAQLLTRYIRKGDKRRQESLFLKKEEEESILLYHFSNPIFEECVGRKKILLFACIFSTGVKRYTEFKGEIMEEI